MYKHKKASKGFTLVELLVVIAIIGVLATLVLLQLGTARAKARDTKRIADVNQLRSAIELYYDDNGAQYPQTLTTTNLGKYIAQPAMPMDPITSVNYFFAYAPAGASNKSYQYHLWTELEQKNSSAMNGDSDIDSTGWTGVGGNSFNAANVSANTGTELCNAAYNAGGARDCVFDTGQK
jgi:type II secretion system protein G